MSTENAIEQSRQKALKKIEEKESLFNYSIVFIALYELILIILLVYFTDFSNSTQVVIFIATFLIYGTLALIIMAFSLYLNTGIEKILYSIQLPTSSIE